MPNKDRNSDREAFWREVAARRDVSGLSVRAFCQGENLPEPDMRSILLSTCSTVTPCS